MSGVGAVLRFDGVIHRAKGRTLIDNVTQHPQPGTFTALVGSNGAGKSTLDSGLHPGANALVRAQRRSRRACNTATTR